MPTMHTAAVLSRQTRVMDAKGTATNQPITFPLGISLPLDRISYGPDIPNEGDLRLLGDLSGKRVLQLGCGDGHNTVALHRAGARVIVVEPDATRVKRARNLFEKENTRVELIPGDVADLASVRAESIDVALSIYALAGVEDLARVFRQVHRVLRPDLPFVFSLPHPAFAMVDTTSKRPIKLVRSYWEDKPRTWSLEDDDDSSGVDYGHTFNRLFTWLTRSNFRVDILLEPEPKKVGEHSPAWVDAMAKVPSTVILRARKLGF